MDPSALEGVLRRASQRGIKVITHEGDSLVNTDVDIEAFDNKAFGAPINEKLAECMGKSGKWTSFVGSLGSLTHNQWVDAGAENAKQYPDMELVAEKNESFNDANRAYEKAKEILRKYPDIKGFQGSSAIDVIGIGRAVEEAGLQDKTCVYGLGLPKDTGPSGKRRRRPDLLLGSERRWLCHEQGLRSRSEGRGDQGWYRPWCTGLRENDCHQGTGQGHHHPGAGLGRCGQIQLQGLPVLIE